MIRSGFREQHLPRSSLLILRLRRYRQSPFKVGSRYPHAGSVRICTCARFKLLDEGRPSEFVILNTHLDNSSDLQRKLGASLLLFRAKYEARGSECPVFVIGDFNRYECCYPHCILNIHVGAPSVLQTMNLIQAHTKSSPVQWTLTRLMQNLHSGTMSRTDNFQAST